MESIERKIVELENSIFYKVFGLESYTMELTSLYLQLIKMYDDVKLYKKEAHCYEKLAILQKNGRHLFMACNLYKHINDIDNYERVMNFMIDECRDNILKFDLTLELANYFMEKKLYQRALINYYYARTLITGRENFHILKRKITDLVDRCLEQARETL